MEYEERKMVKVDTSSIVPTFIFQGKRYFITCKRWGILFLSCCILSFDIFCLYFFSFINDMTSVYFNVTPVMTDLLASLNFVGRTVGAIIVCLFSEWMKLRGITVYGSASNCISILLIAVGVFFGNFALSLFGMFLNGVLSGILMTIVQVITLAWFPFDERGKSGAAPWVVRRLTLMLSNIVATRSLGVYEVTQGHISNNASEHFVHQFQVTFTGVFGLIALMTLLCCVVAAFYVTDTPSVYEGDDILPEQTGENTPLLHTSFNTKSLARQLKDLIVIFKDLSFIIYFCTYIFVSLDNPLGTMLISSLVIKEFPHIADRDVGIFFCIGILVGSFGSAVAGQILDKFAKPQITFICIALLSVTSLAGFSLSFHLHILSGVFAFYLLLWSARDALSVCMLHRLAEMTVHKSHSICVKTFSIAVTLSSLWVAISGFMIRLILKYSSPAISVLFPMPFFVLSIVSYIVFWRHFRGSMASENG